MTSKHLVDPELLPLIQQVPGFQFSRETLPATRAMMQAMRPPVALPPTVTLTERRIPGPAGAPEVRVLIIQPKAAGRGRPGILHIHG
ncbi:MAG TPA: hypothetical protein VMJ74_04830, partial [Pseudomonadales bacterium]|nr:hypothetical protein [Pseudomonadales bacterium]